MQITSVQIVDSHTGGEPTRVVISGGPDLGTGTLAQKRDCFRDQHDDFRATLMREPRGNDVIVGAMLCEPHDSSCEFGVIYFNNAGYIGMCGHGTIGLVTTLYDLGRIQKGTMRIDTPVGPVEATLHDDLTVSVQNVPSYRFQTNVELEVSEVGKVVGDVAWGGNWFFLVKNCPIEIDPKNISQLSAYTRSIRRHLDDHQIRGEDGGIIDHIEVFGPPTHKDADSKNFVLCPGQEFDRSPCGTGTSAKVSCLFADGELKPGEVFTQESIIGSLFEATIEDLGNGKVSPTIRGQAHIHGISTLRMDTSDPFRLGIEL